MTDSAILITAGPYQFLAKFESAAPKTSGEGMWIRFGETNFNISFENHMAHPASGQILLYPGGISETEFLFCYGGGAFASKMGALAANYFLTVTEGSENLHALGNLTLWEGAQDVLFELAEDKIRQFKAGRSAKL
ncbi:Protein of unknown function DUF3830 [Penicillium sp. CMV-2018d]|nr:Protein of unknown function DUF3830 [Penicillium sp. CMV-2018d]